MIAHYVVELVKIQGNHCKHYSMINNLRFGNLYWLLQGIDGLSLYHMDHRMLMGTVTATVGTIIPKTSVMMNCHTYRQNRER